MQQRYPCKICWHELAREINRAIVRGLPIAEIARMYKVPASTVRRHAREHVPRVLEMSHEDEVRLDANALLLEFQELYATAKRLLTDAEQEMNNRPTGSAARDRAALLTASALKEAGRLWEIGARSLGIDAPRPALPGAKREEISIRLVEDDVPVRRDAMGDITREHLSPGRQRALPAPVVQDLAPEPPMSVCHTPEEIKESRAMFRAFADVEIPADLRVKLNEVRTRRGFMPLQQGMTFADALDLTDAECEYNESRKEGRTK